MNPPWIAYVIAGNYRGLVGKITVLHGRLAAGGVF
jgi:hypothetical protein